jgi:hypothetical protein
MLAGKNNALLAIEIVVTTDTTVDFKEKAFITRSNSVRENQSMVGS